MESDEGVGERPSTSGALVKDPESLIGISAMLGFAQSEYSLNIHTSDPIMANRRHLESENDGNATDEEVEICITRLNFLADRRRRLYMDCQLSLPAGGSGPMQGGAEAISVSAVDSCISSPEVRYERLRTSAAEQQKYWRLQKVSFECPLSNCDVMCNSGNLLSHCLMAHADIFVWEIKTAETKSLKFIGKSMPAAWGKSNCVGLLVYEGAKQEAMNSNLPKIYTEWEGRLPVLIMLWKTSWDSVPGGPRVAHIYILWLLCTQAQPPLMVTVETGASPLCLPRRQVILTCPNSDVLENCDFLRDSQLFMRFTHREMKELTRDYSQDIEMQFTIHEVEKIQKLDTIDIKKDDQNEHEIPVAVDELQTRNLNNDDETSKDEFCLENLKD
ncbi:uncharacterized protein LOC108097953 [Drosophila ficusphila]|uniref:uncharacterized protein LOC108097953 n=1 Tax=Drosophila ficusphila TaxID=30025 RepID=UPI0007E6DA10|nr:uncharacterized protein LOC108097953 [Drosophila ficusphila]